jgi:hypothetical protein
MSVRALRPPGGPRVSARTGRSRSAARQLRHEAHISAGGVEKDVDLVETDDVNDEVDTAYSAKYGRSYPSIVPSIVAPEARAATLKLVPR